MKRRPKPMKLRGDTNAFELYARLYQEAEPNPEPQNAERRRLKAPPDLYIRIQNMLSITWSEARAWQRELHSRNGWIQGVGKGGDTLLLKHPSRLTESLRPPTHTAPKPDPLTPARVYNVLLRKAVLRTVEGFPETRVASDPYSILMELFPEVDIPDLEKLMQVLEEKKCISWIYGSDPPAISMLREPSYAELTNRRGGIDFGIDTRAQPDVPTPLAEIVEAKSPVFVPVARTNPIEQLPRQPPPDPHLERLAVIAERAEIKKQQPVTDEPVAPEAPIVTEPIVPKAVEKPQPTRKALPKKRLPQLITSHPSHSAIYAYLTRRAETVTQGPLVGRRATTRPVSRLKGQYSAMEPEQLRGMLNDLADGGFIQWVNLMEDGEPILSVLLIQPPPVDWMPAPDLHKAE